MPIRMARSLCVPHCLQYLTSITGCFDRYTTTHCNEFDKQPINSLCRKQKDVLFNGPEVRQCHVRCSLGSDSEK